MQSYSGGSRNEEKAGDLAFRPFPNFPWQQPQRGCVEHLHGTWGRRWVPGTCALTVISLLGDDRLVMAEGGGASPPTGLRVKPVCMGMAEVWICPHQEAASGQEGGQDLESCPDQAQDRLCG